MRYPERIYGEIEIQEPVLLDLLQTTALQRLDGVLQHGITGLLGITRATSRLEHSLGVMTLVQRLGGSLEEQVAALLHDVSHTAFSHVMDYVFESQDGESFHETAKDAYLRDSDIPPVLARHGFNWRNLLRDENFPLLEQPAPALCADRLDYFLRDSLDLGLATQADIDQALAHLVVAEGRIGVDSLKTARWMAETYLAADEKSWANLREIGLYQLAALAIQAGLRYGVIGEADIWSTDQAAWEILANSTHPKVQARVQAVSVKTHFVRSEEAPTFWVKVKLRTIDPEVLQEGRLQPLSTLDEAFHRQRRAYLQRRAGPWPVAVWVD